MTRVSPLLVLLFALGCATSKSAAPTPTEAAPAKSAGVDIEQLLAREAEGLSPQSVTVEGKALQVVAAGAPKVETEGKVSQLTIPIGTSQPVECTTQHEQIDAGSSLWRVLQSVVQAGKVEIVTLRPSGVQLIEKDASLGLRAVYRVSTPEGVKVGELKVSSLAGENVSVICIHDEPGYAKTFDRVMASVASSLTRANPSSRPHRYVEISQIKVQGMPVGFTKEAIYDSEGKPGQSVAVHVSSMIMPRSAKEMLADDTVIVRHLDKAGRLALVQWVHGVNGELDGSVTATREGTNAYRYQGKHSGKDVNGTFKSEEKAGLPGDPIVRTRILKELLSGKKAELKLQEYSPSADFSVPTTSTFKRDPSGPNLVTMETSGFSVRTRVDAKGMAEWAEMQLGPVQMVSERLLAEGTP